MELYVYLDENKQIREFLTLENTKRGTTAGGLYIIWKVKDYEDADTINDLVAQAEFQNLDHELIKDYRIVSNIKTLYFTESDLKGIDTKYFKANYEYKAQNGHCVRHIPAAEIPTDSALITENTVLCVISYLNTTENYEDSSVVIPFSVEYGTISSSVITKSEYQYLLGLIANNPNYLKVATGDRLINDLDLGTNSINSGGKKLLQGTDVLEIGNNSMPLYLKGAEEDVTYNGEELAKKSQFTLLSGVVEEYNLNTNNRINGVIDELNTKPSYGALDTEIQNVNERIDITDNYVDGLQTLVNTKASTEYVDTLGASLSGRINDIDDLITSDTTSSNPLANQDFVNSSISTNTANFIGTFDTLEELLEQTGTPNDYAFWNSNEGFKRYKLNKDLEWEYEYTLNTSGLTEEQLAVLNSGISAEIVEHIVNDNEEQTITGKKTFKSESVRAYPIKIETSAGTEGIQFKNQYHTAHLDLSGYGFQFDASLGVSGNITPIGTANIGASDNAWKDLCLSGEAKFIPSAQPTDFLKLKTTNSGIRIVRELTGEEYPMGTIGANGITLDANKDLTVGGKFISGNVKAEHLYGNYYFSYSGNLELALTPSGDLFTSTLQPLASTYNIGKSTNPYKDLYLSGNIVATDGRIDIKDADNGNVAWLTNGFIYTANLLPFDTNLYSLGTSGARFKDLCLAGKIDLLGASSGGLTIKNNGWTSTIEQEGGVGLHLAGETLQPTTNGTKNLGGINNYWKDIYFSGKLTPPTETLANNVLSIKHATQEDDLGTLTTDISIVDGGVVDSFQAIVSFDIGDNVVGVSFPSEWVWREENNLVEDGLNANAHYVIALEKRSGKVFAKYDIYYV